MGVGRRKLVPFWVLALALACGQHTGQARQDTLKSDHEHHSDFSLLQGHDAAPLHGVTIIPPLRTIPVVRALNPAHTGRVCSTWGDFHYKTFDGQVFRFPGLCNYVFSAHCGAAYEDFNIQLRRGRESNATTLSRVTMKLDGLVVDLTKSSVLVNNHPVQLPFSQSGVLIELSSGYLKVVARLGLVFMWNDDDSLLLELDTKYFNKTCGLCGDFNGSPESSEFLSHNVRLTPLEFGNLQKMDGPTEQCQDPLPVPQKNCSTRFGICEEILKGHLFSDCSALVDTSSYLEACRQDLCLCESPDLSSCVCHTLAEYSRQCAHAGGQPQDWRGPDLCSPTCPLNMQHQECGSPCVDTCSNFQRSQVCEDHCVAGCFCPEGTVLDDINHTGCVPVSQCACLYNGTTYAPGTNYSTDCTKCTCSGGQWNCQEVPCPGTCSVLGGAHFSTFDERQYTVHGDCSYVLSKPCDSNIFSVLAELRKCGLTDSETCLKSVTLSLGGGKTVVMVKATGEVFVNQIYTQLPVSTANVTLFRPSTFFIIAQTNLGLQLEIQLVPIMQVFVRLAPELRGLTCGLCGNFNSIQADDFQTMSGVVEGTAAAFFNTFKTQAACPNVRNNFEDPCSLSVENEKYAQHWCSQLTDASGPFSQCHTTVNPSTYFSNCMFDTCNCEKSEDCMCAALSSYVRACAAKGVLLSGWRDGVCTKPTMTCPKSMTYHYHISTCQPTCRSLNEEDVTCHVNFIPVDGCTCPAGTFLDDSGKCVQATSCPCYHRGSTVPNGESVHDSGAICTCTQGTLTCIGGPAPTPVCDAPMIYFDCRNATPGDTGAGCQKSCHTLDMTCYSSECVPGCVCPHGLVADGNGGCVVAEDCPCVHNEATYRPGETIRVGCNNCTCENRMWRCTDKPCLATCAVYGDGHYLTFDGQRYSFSGNCEYTLLQDHCGGNGSSQDAFRVVTENIPCGTTGTTCSKDIKIFLGNYELKLSDGKVEVVQKGVGQEPPYYVHQMGIYLVVETDVGLVLLWDRKTSIFLRLSPEFKGRVCGLCGNFDDNAINDFTTRSQSVVSDMLEFGNSWKFSPSCPDAVVSKDPCTANPYRKSWAQKQCSIINSETFTACHAHVEPAKYYEACVSDACACDSGGDCECFCTAVAAYAQACHEVGVCVSWRTPDICPLFCDYYNPEGQCEWHYQPCGAPCMRTCQNPNGHCLHDLPGLEGCYPKCPPTAPIFDEGMMQCVRNCTVTPSPLPPRPCRVNGKLYRPGATVPSDKNCYSCICTENGVSCAHDAGACVCTYNGQHFHPGEIIYHTTDGTGGCISAHCRANGTIERTIEDCSSTTPTPPTTFSFSTPVVMTSMPPSSTHPSPTLSVVYTGSPSRAVLTTSSMSSVKTPATASTASTMASTSTTPGCQECHWSPWMDVSHPGRGIDSGDFETLENLRAHGYQICQAPRAVECRAEDTPEVPLHVLGQQVECSTTVGLTCHNRDQVSRLCDNYQIRIQCCTPISCPTSSGPTQTTHLITSRTATMGTTTSLIPVTSTAHTESTVISGRSTHAPGPFPSSSRPFSSAPSPTTLGPVSSTAIKVNLSTASPMPQPTSATSSVSIPSTGATTASFETTHECTQELCSWTDWIDGSYPRPDRNSGDFDTFKNLRSKGYKFCEKPRNVECRAQFFPNTPLEELGQDVICNREEGLICLNKNQLPPICYNYEIRIECCKVVDLCSTASATTLPTSREISTKTKTNWTTSLHSSSTKGTSTHSATIHTETWATDSPHTITQPGTTHCQPQCNWTKWFDTDFPVPGPHGGDLETYSNILRRGERICHWPEEITQLECRAENHPEMRVEDLGQVVQCDPTVGLVCRNRDQKDISGMCLNYEVRVLCCRIPEGCPGTSPATLSSTSGETVPSSAPVTTSVHAAISTSTPPTRTTIVQTTSTTSTSQTSSASVQTASTVSTRGTSTISVQTGSTVSTRDTRTTSGHPASTMSTRDTSSTSVQTASTVSTRGTSTTSGQPASTTYIPQTSSPSRGKLRTTLKTRTSSTSIEKSSTTSEQPASTMSTRDTSTTSGHPASTMFTRDTSSTSVQTASTTSIPESKPTSGQQSSTTSTPQTRTTPIGKSITTSGQPASTMSTRDTRTTSVQTASTTSMPESKPTSGQPVSTTSMPQTRTTPIGKSSTTSGQPSSTTSTSQTRTTPIGKSSTTSGHPASTMFTRSTSTTSEPIASTTFIGKTSTISVPGTRATSVPTSTTGPGSPSVVTSFPGTTHCQPQCNWTKWFDTDFPVPGPHGGDLETYSNILRRGERICHRPEEITQLECRAENHPEMRVEDLGQVVQCDPTVGLVCRNRDQKDFSGMCLNYEVRVLCCRIPEGCPGTSPATLSSTSGETVTSSAPVTTSVHAAISTTMPRTRTTIVQTTSTTSTPQTSSASVQTGSTVSTRGTSTIFVQTASTVSTRGTSTISVQTASTTSMPKHRPTSGQPVSTTSKPQTRTTPIGKSSTTFGQTASTTSGQTDSTTYIPQTSSPSREKLRTTLKTQTSSTSIEKSSTTSEQPASTMSTRDTSTTSGHPASTMSTRDTSSTSVQTASTTSIPESKPTSWHQSSTTSTPQTRTTPIGKSITTSGQAASTMFTRDTRTTSAQTASTTSIPESKPTSGQPSSTTSLSQTRATPIGKSSTTSGHPASTMFTRSTSTTSVQTASTTFIGKTSTFSVPGTRATSAPASTTGPGSPSVVTSFPGTTHCQPQCNWTKWFDTDFPVPGPHGGDLETYSNILRRGERICHRPEEITQLECRAENHPEMRVEDLGQVVQCDPTVGLVCRNRDQKDISGMCLNYEVRVLCCRIPEGCPGTSPATLSSTSGETVTSSAPVTTSVHAAISTSTPRTRTTIVQTTSTTSTPQTSSASVQTGSTVSTRGTSTISVQTASTTSMPKHRPTSGQPVSTTSKPQTRTTPIGKSSTTSGQPASTMFTRSTRTTSGQTASTTYIPQTSSPSRGKLRTTLKTQTSSTSAEKSSTTSEQPASTMSTRDTSTTSVQTASTTSIPESKPTSGQQSSTTSIPQTRTTPIGKSITTSGHAASTMSPSVQTASTTSMPKPRPTSGQPVSTTSKPQTRTIPIGKSSTTSGHTASTTFTRSTSTTSVQTASTTFMGKISTISVPGTRATSAPASTTGPGSPSVVTSFPGTTHCQPQCNWTKWFDTDFPVPGPHGGDLETYSNILRRGERICHRPEEITQLECRAENHPEMRVEDLGQVVQCDPTVGLVCRNRDQKDISGMCLNYEVRVLCCRIPEGCPGTSATPTVTSSHKPSFPVVSPSSVSPSSLTSPRVHSTTPCSCSVAGHLYPIGSIIYNKTDLDGHCYYAMCSQDCQVVRSVSQDCPSTTPSPTPALFTSTSTTTPVIHRERCNVVPPRMKGDIWHMPNCSQATCEGNNVVSLSPRQCPEVKAPSCANGYPPVKVDDQDGCCQHFQCQCVCSGWGDPHYITFDGTYYTFLDNCTYVLVQQIVPVFGHFRVLIDNYFCDPGDSVSCPQSIIVEYHQDRVVLTRRPVDGIMTNQIIFNNKVVNPGFQQNGIIVSRVGIKMYVTIQEIGVQVMFSGLIFSVEVPFNMFANNTEGQCGTCTNDQKDECRLPGGALTSCSKMAPHWKVPNQPSCQGPPPTSTSVVPSPSQAPCPPSPICELLLSNLFQSCHDIIPPLAFYEGCLFDSCHGLTLEVVCSALELYASLCAAQGRCIPWRSQTNNTCPFTCPDNKVYQPCGPTNPQYCYRNDDISTSLTLQEAGPFTEGCFCPDNMTPFSTNDSICVPSCQWCLGPHGEPVEPGHTISIGCEDCTCREATLTCQRKPCPQTTCPEPGFVPVLEGLEAGQCCPQFSCACNFSHCPPPLHCPENSSLVVTYEEGVCCPSQTCSSRKGCEVNGTLYQPGAVISSSLCEACLCEAPSNFHSDVFVVRCENKLCSNIQCPQGFEYQVKPGQCCGQCIQKGCLVKNSNSSTYFYLPGESWPEPEDPCVTHKCEQLQDVFTVVTMKKECPKIDCPPGHAQLREDGCCYDCLLPQQKCTVHQRQQIIRQQNCSSEGPVSLTYCQGNCGDSTSMYSLEANTVEHKCECCQELQTSQRSVTLRCDDGSSRTFSYTQVEKCGCLGQRCHALGDTSHPESPESESKSKGSKEHGQ
ncbi:mucin-5AC [Peromyscus maniculatus bairdii]|uniref:mucin-5AC n=1 Tax=Peromyscus maniculatus bairdii TaxID=230844 RepID=UPI003FCFB826